MQKYVAFALSPILLTLVVGHPFGRPEPTGSPTQSPAIPPTRLAETFDGTANEDQLRSGAEWGQGALTWGIGGGAGRLGDLVVRNGEVVVLNTEHQEFPLPGQPRNLLDNAIPGVDYDPLDQATWPTITVTDGNFEFGSVEIEAGGTLVLEGANPGRVLARGQVVHHGLIDLSGESAPAHRSNSGGGHPNNGDAGQETKYGGTGGSGGPAAGSGGKGADRMNMENATLPLMVNVGGIVFDPPDVAVNVGTDGEGVGGSTPTGGVGGVHWPPALPTTNNMNVAGFGDAEISVIPPNDSGIQECGIGMVAGPGSGGAYALLGGAGVPVSPYTSINPGILPNTPADTPGGDNAALVLGPPGDESGIFVTRRLDWVMGHLRGGSGGGGGGTSLFGSRLNAGGPPDCNNASLFPFFDHSGAGGGGGGGALQVVGGRKLAMHGVIDCAGGDGGSSVTPGATLLENCDHSGNTGAGADCEDFAAPGGGGSGGALKLQSKEIELAPLGGRFVLTGGEGGVGAGGSFGGNGSPGLVRAEYSGFVDAGTEAGTFARRIDPYYPESATPPPGFNDPYLSAAILSLGSWGASRFRPDAFSGAQSCWMKAGNTDSNFALLADVSSDPLAPWSDKGWNLKVRYAAASGVKEFWYRGQALVPDSENPLAGATDFETYLGNQLNHYLPAMQGSLFAVRFQGVHAIVPHSACELDLSDSGGEILPGSLTPWVKHPHQLNAFGVDINRIRFCVVFEPGLGSTGAIEGNILGVTDLVIRISPY